jgi:hypothetical protein
VTEDFYAAADRPKRRPGLSLARQNQKLIAERTGWPEGALKTCWELEGKHPGWMVDWLHENTIKGFERPAGFRASLIQGMHKCDVFAPDPAELESLMEAVPEHDYHSRSCLWCLDQATARVRRFGL